MILINETKLTKGCIATIGECYGMEYDYNNFNEETYERYIESIIDKLTFINKYDIIKEK